MNRQEKVERITKWASELTAEQMRPLLVALTDYAYESEYVCLGDLAPYWEATGEPLIEGQETWAENVTGA